MITSHDVIHCIDEYLRCYPRERSLLRLRQHISDGGEFISRKEFHGHITCGALVLNGQGRVLQVRHRILNKWLLPGGHVEPEDMSLMDATLRELEEEVGVRRASLECISVADFPVPVDINRHLIPANEAKSESAHHHWDFRFLFKTKSAEVRIQEAEVTGAEWREFIKLESRLREKVRTVVLSPATVIRRVA